MDLEIKVSVIIPVFNAVDYLVDTIKSCLNQTYKNLEIIIVDDSSDDGSLELVKNIKDERIKLHKNPKKGACSARNYGYQIATGEYIQYLDADDILSLNKIEEQLKLANKYGKDTIYSCSWYHFKSSIDKAVKKRQAIDKDYAQPHDWLNDSWLGNGMGQTSIWLTSKALIEKAGIWNESLHMNQDGEFFCRVLLNAKGIIYSENAKAYYRTGNPKSISQKNNMGHDKTESLLLSFISYKKFAAKHNLLSELKKGLAQNFLMYIYHYYSLYPDLIKTAEKEFYNLGYKKMWPVGGEKFKTFARIVGFKNSLKLKALR